MPDSSLGKFKDLTEDISDDIADDMKEIKSSWKRLFFFLSSVFLLFILLIITLIAIYQEIYKNKIYPGVNIGYFNIGGHTLSEAHQILFSLTEKSTTQGFTFIIKGTDQDQQVLIPTILIAPEDPDLTRETLSFDFNSTLQQAWQYGRTGDFINRFEEQLQLLLFGKKVDLVYQFDEEVFEQNLKQKISHLENPGADARLIITQGKATVIPEKPGNSFDYKKAITETKYAIESLTFRSTTLVLKADIPKIRIPDTPLAVAKAEHILGFSSTTLWHEDKSWKLKNSTLEKLLEFKLLESGAQKNKKEIGLGFNQASTTAFLETIAAETDIEPQNAKFEVASTTAGRLRATKFQTSGDGRELDIIVNLKNLEQEIIYKDNHEINLVVNVLKPQVNIANINPYGIKELVGVGESNFAGSPQNRRHNIKTGAEKLNGLLISPDEEFSLVKALGNISSETGYLPELVIKGNRTIPEYGGGLCQIGTTNFRVALYAGLPITERRPHSYRVVYYEPAGMDATIYNPWPDFKFINDTGHYLVLTTEIQGDILRFKLYGTSDGRKIYIENPPRLWNIVSPGPTKIIETLDLAPGEKKCTESSHNGADAEFERKITYTDDREPLEEKWFSRYRPWQAVCLLGVEELTVTTTTDDVVE